MIEQCDLRQCVFVSQRSFVSLNVVLHSGRATCLSLILDRAFEGRVPRLLNLKDCAHGRVAEARRKPAFGEPRRLRSRLLLISSGSLCSAAFPRFSPATVAGTVNFPAASVASANVRSSELAGRGVPFDIRRLIESD